MHDKHPLTIVIFWMVDKHLLNGICENKAMYIDVEMDATHADVPLLYPAVIRTLNNLLNQRAEVQNQTLKRTQSQL